MSIYGKPEIKSLADLKGKVLGLTVPGATTDFAARHLLQQAGLTPGKDVKLLYLKGMVEILAGVRQGSADAMHRDVEHIDGAYALREQNEVYDGNLPSETEPLRLENTFLWDENAGTA